MQTSSSHFISLAILWNSKWKETEEISNIFSSPGRMSGELLSYPRRRRRRWRGRGRARVQKL